MSERGESMTNKNDEASSSGISFGGALLLIFITLKLCKVIDWSWVLVLSPLWISLLLAVLVIVVAAIKEISAQ